MASHVYRFVSRLVPYSNRTGQNVSANAIVHLFLSYYHGKLVKIWTHPRQTSLRWSTQKRAGRWSQSRFVLSCKQFKLLNMRSSGVGMVWPNARADVGAGAGARAGAFGMENWPASHTRLLLCLLIKRRAVVESEFTSSQSQRTKKISTSADSSLAKSLSVERLETECKEIPEDSRWV